MPEGQRLGPVFGGDNCLCLYHTEFDFLFGHAISCIGEAFDQGLVLAVFGLCSTKPATKTEKHGQADW